MTDHPNFRRDPSSGVWVYDPTSESVVPEDTTILPRIQEPVEIAARRPMPDEERAELEDQPVEPSDWDYQIAGATGLPVSVVMAVLDAVDGLTLLPDEPSMRSRVWNRCWQGAAVATIALWSGFLGTMTAHTVAIVFGWGQ